MSKFLITSFKCSKVFLAHKLVLNQKQDMQGESNEYRAI